MIENNVILGNDKEVQRPGNSVLSRSITFYAINTGTILAANSMDELASVVAHEVAHISQRHYESGADARKKALLMQIKYLALPFAITCYLAKRIFYYNTAYFWQKFLKLAMYISFQFNPRCFYTKKRCKLYP